MEQVSSQVDRQIDAMLLETFKDEIDPEKLQKKREELEQEEKSESDAA